MIHKWKFVSRKILLEHPRMTLVEDAVKLPDGKVVAYLREAPVKGFSVAVFAINNKNEVLLQKEYSYPPDKVMYQLPGGSAELDEDIAKAANRELSEESGYKAKKCTVLGSFYVNNRRSDGKQYVVLCEDLTAHKLNEDAEEFIESFWIALEEISKLIKNGQIENINLLAALQLYNAQNDT